jgi:hypothetical protein
MGMESRIGKLSEGGKSVNAGGIVLALLFSGSVWAQEPPRVRDLTPSTILAPGQWEAKLFTSVYTQNEFFDDEGERRDAGARSTYLTSILSLSRGAGERWNAGLEATLRGVRDESYPEDDRDRFAIASLAPKAKWAPWKSQPTLSVQGSLSIPIASDLSGGAAKPFLDFGDPVAGAQVFYDWRHSPGWLTYLEQGAFVRFAHVEDGESTGKDDAFTTASKAIANFYPTDAWTLYAAEELLFDWRRGAGPDWYFQSGLGVKRAIGSSFEVEILGTMFPWGRNKGAGNTLGLGFRYLL